MRSWKLARASVTRGARRGWATGAVAWSIALAFAGCAPDFDALTRNVSCQNGERDDTESDVDCGGDCGVAGFLCEDGKACDGGSDCESGVCSDGICGVTAEETCSNDSRDEDEADIDCGGACAPAKLCANGRRCTSGPDCASGSCTNGVCGEPSCSDETTNQQETDVDCGGGCTGCDVDRACLGDDDCKSGVCTDRVCVAQSCSDNLLSPELDETGVDCGGLCATAEQGYKRCLVGQRCETASDCRDFVCNPTSGECDAPPPPPDAGDVVDDFEDGDSVISQIGGRMGMWYTYGDGTGTSTTVTTAEIPGGRGQSELAAHISGEGFTIWGAGFGADLNNPSGGATTKQPYDASAQTGVEFWARSDSGSSVQMLVIFPSSQTDPSGGMCSTGASAPAEELCDDHFVVPVTVTAEWKHFEVAFADSDQLSFGKQYDALDPALLVGIQFRFANGVDFDVWVDDLAFYAE